MHYDKSSVNTTTEALIISPDREWSRKARQHLIEQGISCDIASNGKEGQLKAYQKPYEYYFLDLEVKNISGVEVFNYLRSSRPHANVFVTVASPEILNEFLLSERNLLKMGVKKVLIKAPHDSLAEHIRSIGKIKVWEKVKFNPESKGSESEAAIEDTEFCSVKISEIYPSAIAAFDYYLKLGSNRYIKIIHQGENPDHTRLQNYEQNGAESLYFKKQERAVYISYQNHLVREELKFDSHDASKIMKAVKSTADKYLEEAVTEGIRNNLVEEGKAICQNMYNVAKSDKDLKKILTDFEELKPEEFSHSFLVSFFSTLICRGLDWAGEKTINTLVIGALFHDIGLLQLPDSISGKELKEMTSAEMYQFQSHTALGASAMKSLPGMNQGVLQIIEQHHERVNGSGYPLGLSGNRIYPLAKVVGLADEFASYIRKSGISPRAGLKGFVSSEKILAQFDSELVKNLIRAFK